VKTYIPAPLRNIIKATQPAAARSPSDLTVQVNEILLIYLTTPLGNGTYYTALNERRVVNDD
jgi:selenophosphate synthase